LLTTKQFQFGVTRMLPEDKAILTTLL
jgi:hypothetical protein